MEAYFWLDLAASVKGVRGGAKIDHEPALRATSKNLSEQIKSGSHARTAHDRRRVFPRILMGLEVALLASRALAGFLYGTSVHDPWVLVASVAVLMLIASAASLAPALRAARIDPMEALRAE